MDIGLLLVRLVFGMLLAAHGCQKLFGWFGGSGFSATAAFFESLGFQPGRLFVFTAALGEIGGGLFLALGLVSPGAAAAIMSVMLVAITTVHWGKGLLAPHGIEHPLMYLVAVLSLALTGPGMYSLDAALGLTRLWTPLVVGLALAAGIVGGVLILGVRRAGALMAHA